jgi:hypothetical protein
MSERSIGRDRTRELQPHEARLLVALAQRIGGDIGRQLANDVAHANAREISSLVTGFEIDGYERGSYRGQHPFPFEAIVTNHIGEAVWITVFADDQNRLLELLAAPGKSGSGDWSKHERVEFI